jgi:hypothetical protein
MADDEKTRKLRERLDAIKPQSNINTSEEEVTEEPRKVHRAWGQLGAFIGKNSAFWGAQYIILTKLNVPPFLWWESVIILAGIVAVISNFKK